MKNAFNIIIYKIITLYKVSYHKLWYIKFLLYLFLYSTIKERLPFLQYFELANLEVIKFRRSQVNDYCMLRLSELCSGVEREICLIEIHQFDRIGYSVSLGWGGVRKFYDFLSPSPTLTTFKLATHTKKTHLSDSDDLKRI